jgi:hypothetical protein
VPAGTRLVARARCAAATPPTNYWVHAHLFTMLGDAQPLVPETVGAVPASSDGTVLDPGATAGVKGPWVQLTAATARAARAVTVMVGQRSTAAHVTHRIDIGVGASGAEQVVVPDLTMHAATTGRIRPSHVTLPVAIPSASRSTPTRR